VTQSPPAAPARILIVDDHPLFREGIRQYLERQPDLEVCGECATAEEALQAVPEMQPDLVTVDISLGGSSGIDLVRALRLAHPDVVVLVVSMHDESLYAERSLRAGAMGYVMKHDPPRTVVDAIHCVLAGGQHLSAKMKAGTAGGHAAEAGDAPVDVELLSEREREVFGLIGRGKATREIAEIMDLTIPTINSFRARIKEKLRIRSGAELTVKAMNWVQNESGIPPGGE